MLRCVGYEGKACQMDDLNAVGREVPRMRGVHPPHATSSHQFYVPFLQRPTIPDYLPPFSYYPHPTVRYYAFHNIDLCLFSSPHRHYKLLIAQLS